MYVPSGRTVTKKPAIVFAAPGLPTKMSENPKSTAVRRPFCDTVATLSNREVQMTVEVTSFFDPSDIVASADS
jgi:hypothetical protein